MVAKSILEIDIADSSYEAFQAKFLKYQEQVAKQPSAWKRVGEAAKGTGSEYVKLGKTIAETVKGIQYAANRQQAFAVAAAGTARTFVGMVKSTKQLVGNLKDGAAMLIKWSGIIGLISGVVGAGGLFGIARLASSASQQRRDSQGLGVSGGELSAAQINYQKLVNVDDMLGRINEARNDVNKRWAFKAAGINPADMQGKSNAEVLTMLIPALKSTFERSGGTLQGAQAHGLTEFADLSTLTRLKAVSKEELDATEQAYRASVKQLSVADNVNRAWQQLEITFKNTGSAIEKLFKEKLVSLSGPLGQLSEAFTKAVKVFLDSPKIGKWIGEISTGLEAFAKYLTSDNFSKDVNSFLDALDEMGGRLVKAAQFLGKVFNIGSEKTLKASEYHKLDELRKINKPLAEAMQYRLENPEAAKEKGDKFNARSGFALKRNSEVERQNIQDAINGADGAQVKQLLESLGISTATQSASGKIKPFAGQAKALPGSQSDAQREKENGLRNGLLSAMEWKESKYNPRAIGPMTKYGTAKGAFQFLDSTAGEYGITDPFNREQEADAAARKMGGLLKRYKGDLSKALSAYNWGEGNLDKFGMENRPAQTRDYVTSILGRLEQTISRAVDRGPARQSSGGAQTFRIENATGGNAVVIGSQLAQ
ncbi:MAG: lytic transglycosylase domain-containing protein [Alphaproteobacteria bacterium]|nr:lytic transglycosylase domain-containing protein [Alphaproteobacteria bacterium]